MSSSEKVRIILAREEGLPLSPPPPPMMGEGGNAQRQIPKGHEFESRNLKPLTRTLFSTSVALGHALAAFKEFARIKSSNISPDGMIGGKGYVLKVRDVRSKLQQACELLSSLTDTIHDEIQGPHWKPKMAELSPLELRDINELLGDSEQVMDDPERFGEKEVQEAENGTLPGVKKTEDRVNELENKANEASRMPDAGSKEVQQIAPSPGSSAMTQKQASSWKAPSALLQFADSSLPVNTLPGPRVDHLDRGDQLGPGGSYNRDEPLVDDDWGRSEGAPPKTLNKVWSSGAWGSTALPSDDTPTEGNDFGIGYGARGQGSQGYGTRNPDGRGVWGPQSGLPDDPKTPTKDPSGTPLQGGPTREYRASQWGSGSQLPNDGEDPVARSDYYDGDKGNLVNVTQHGNRPVGQAQLPGDGTSVNYDSDRDLPRPGTVYEQQAVPYVKRDWDTHNDRNDLQDLYKIDNKVTNNG